MALHSSRIIFLLFHLTFCLQPDPSSRYLRNGANLSFGNQQVNPPVRSNHGPAAFSSTVLPKATVLWLQAMSTLFAHCLVSSRDGPHLNNGTYPSLNLASPPRGATVYKVHPARDRYNGDRARQCLRSQPVFQRDECDKVGYEYDENRCCGHWWPCSPYRPLYHRRHQPSCCPAVKTGMFASVARLHRQHVLQSHSPSCFPVMLLNTEQVDSGEMELCQHDCRNVFDSSIDHALC